MEGAGSAQPVGQGAKPDKTSRARKNPPRQGEAGTVYPGSSVNRRYGSRILELSTKCKAADAFQVAEARSYLTDKV